jgi:hypothetical protein
VSAKATRRAADKLLDVALKEARDLARGVRGVYPPPQREIIEAGLALSTNAMMAAQTHLAAAHNLDSIGGLIRAVAVPIACKAKELNLSRAAVESLMQHNIREAFAEAFADLTPPRAN